MVRVHGKLSQVLPEGLAKAPTLLELFEYPTVGALAGHLSLPSAASASQQLADGRQIEELKKGRSRLRQKAKKGRAGGTQ
jgi:hypothetical protein